MTRVSSTGADGERRWSTGFWHDLNRPTPALRSFLRGPDRRRALPARVPPGRQRGRGGHARDTDHLRRAGGPPRPGRVRRSERVRPAEHRVCRPGWIGRARRGGTAPGGGGRAADDRPGDSARLRTRVPGHLCGGRRSAGPHRGRDPGARRAPGHRWSLLVVPLPGAGVLPARRHSLRLGYEPGGRRRGSRRSGRPARPGRPRRAGGAGRGVPSRFGCGGPPSGRGGGSPDW